MLGFAIRFLGLDWFTLKLSVLVISMSDEEAADLLGSGVDVHTEVVFVVVGKDVLAEPRIGEDVVGCSDST